MIIKAALHSLARPDATASGVREAAADIDGEVARLNRLVNDVLDFARPIRFERSAVSINALCRESATAALASFDGTAIACDLDPDVGMVHTDPERLRIALINLLVNARDAVNGNGARSKHEEGSPAAGSVANGAAVTLKTAAAGDNMRIVVADHGPGITQPDLAQIFDPYFTTKRGGTGLGLPIVKNIVEGLGGTIVVSSAPGDGTRFVIEFPLDSSQHQRVDDDQSRPTT